jgi:hypothetical protein
MVTGKPVLSFKVKVINGDTRIQGYPYEGMDEVGERAGSQAA